VTTPKHFLMEQIERDLAEDTYGGKVVTRFPPEPNGFLHIGHAKAVLTDFGLARQYGGRCHLRFDDTNPTVEDTRFVEAIQRDIAWLGCDWDQHLYFASDYFPKLYAFAQRLIREGKAYVCSLTLDQIRETRGTVTEPGTPSPDRDRDPQESLRLLDEMRRGQHPDGAYTVRAKIDMAHVNMKMRDPLMYRIRNVPHHRTGDAWHIYPMYDFAHGLSDAIEGVTHSICTLEFENNRELYDWFVEAIFEPPVPRQYEFARFNMTTIVTSKRKLLRLVEEGHVDGWDDPRMPTLAGQRNRGVPPEAIRVLMERVGLSRVNSMVDVALYDHTIRDVLNDQAPRRMGVLRPLPVTISNWDADTVDWLDCDEWPHDVPKQGSRKVPFTRQILIDHEDFAKEPPKGWRRVTPGVEVRLRHAYLMTVERVIEDESGQITGLEARIDPDSRGGRAPDGRKVKGTVHWVSASEGVRATVRLVDRLFTWERPEEHPEGYLAALNPDALQVLTHAVIEPSVAQAPAGTRYQLERVGYFHVDPVQDQDQGEALQLTRIVPLKDSWARPADKVEPKPEPKTRKAPERKRTRKSASEQLQELLDERPEVGERLHALQALGLSEDDAVTVGTDDDLHALFEGARQAGADLSTVTTWLANDVRGLLKDRDSHGLTGEHLATLVGLVGQREITSKVGRKVLAKVVDTGQDPEAIIDREGLRPVRDRAVLEGHLRSVMEANAGKVEAYRGGNTNLRGFFVGQVMRATGGRADPRVLQQLVSELLDA